MRILITGGLGYLGARLAQYLATNTIHSIQLGTRKNISTVDWLSQVKVVNTNWNSSFELENICQDVDIVIHLAGMNASDCMNNPTLALKVNGFSTKNLLQAAISKNVNRFIYLSSAHVYGSPLIGKIIEKSATRNLHPYATSHKAGEDIVRSANSKGEIEGIVIRLSNSFGPPVDVQTNCWSLLTNDLCRQAAESSIMIIKNRVNERRDFISLSNASRAIEHLINLPSNQLNDGLFNLGGEWSPTITEVAKILSDRIYLLSGKNIIIKSQSLSNNSKSSKLDFDISKIKLTGFELINDRNKEFDNLIQFCFKNFGA
jgi:UDP-glucose 4-epimerase